MGNPFVEYDNIIMLLEPKDIASTATIAGYIDLKTVQGGGFLVVFGAVTSTTVTDTMVITMDSATAFGATEEALSFSYRLSGALGTNTWGAVTTCASTGVTIDPAADDNKMVWIEIDPADIQAQNEDARYVCLKLTDTPDMEACLVTVLAITRPRYRQTTHTSVTASASA